MNVEKTYDEDGQVKYEVKSDKFNTFFTVHKSNDGFVFYEVSISKGKVPKSLSGFYTKPEIALKALKEYIRKAKPSKSVQRDIKTAIREEQKRNARKLQSDNKEHVQ